MDRERIKQRIKRERRKLIWNILFWISAVVCGGSFLALLIVSGIRFMDIQRLRHQNTELSEKRVQAMYDAGEKAVIKIPVKDENGNLISEKQVQGIYSTLYNENSDMIGWLSIDDTNIDYPVMQTKEDEDYYLMYDFYGKRNRNGSLVLDSDSEAGIGTVENNYKNGVKPSSNLIIHGHAMKTGDMFGKLHLYQEKSYGLTHSRIQFDTLYEDRRYELISVFYSEVYEKQDKVFKYYNFFEAGTPEEFDNWYRNIKEMSLYDTGVEAVYGDEFLTLSSCSYHVEEGRFVVIAKRIYE